jgi:hypothetical protein
VTLYKIKNKKKLKKKKFWLSHPNFGQGVAPVVEIFFKKKKKKKNWRWGWPNHPRGPDQLPWGGQTNPVALGQAHGGGSAQGPKPIIFLFFLPWGGWFSFLFFNFLKTYYLIFFLRFLFFLIFFI